MKPELLQESAIISALSDGYWRVSVIDEVDSTQNYLRTSNPKIGNVITAEYQSEGRGRLDRKFEATKSSALLFSLFIGPKRDSSELGFLTLLIGATIAKVLNEITKTELFNCKWPNDILCNQRKIAGILAERNESGVIIGVGINVSTERGELPVSHASSIFLETGQIIDRNYLLATILNTLRLQLSDWEAGLDLTDTYRSLSSTLGQSVRILLPGGASIESIASDIDATGALHLVDGQIITVGDVIHLDSKLAQ